MATINGIPVNFGFTGAADANNNYGITTTNLSGVLTQNADVTDESELEVTRNGTGDRVVHGHYDLHKSFSLEYVVTGASLAGAKTNSTRPAPGSFINITACASMPELISAAWEVQRGGKTVKSNTGSAKITLPLMLSANITAVAT